ncbi:hypothetical protein N8T08_008244 [Aspergillus melleus]|uniref:Uncharacterized protein n=1 Tax=Aspergillus melleus TaxID=138277 RepID=A0ACC3AVX7_9EURO|nr:hypothetical protein N8T08_008244 [Aspergillus melleus]
MPVASGTYETGFQTDLVMSLKEIQFYGGIVVNESGEFDLNLNPNGPRYTGHPTRELDAAWDEIVVLMFNTAFIVWWNYLRKALYPRFYPTINEVKDNIPSHWTHIGKL